MYGDTMRLKLISTQLTLFRLLPDPVCALTPLSRGMSEFLHNEFFVVFVKDDEFVLPDPKTLKPSFAKEFLEMFGPDGSVFLYTKDCDKGKSSEMGALEALLTHPKLLDVGNMTPKEHEDFVTQFLNFISSVFLCPMTLEYGVGLLVKVKGPGIFCDYNTASLIFGNPHPILNLHTVCSNDVVRLPYFSHALQKLRVLFGAIASAPDFVLESAEDLNVDLDVYKDLVAASDTYPFGLSADEFSLFNDLFLNVYDIFTFFKVDTFRALECVLPSVCKGCSEEAYRLLSREDRIGFLKGFRSGVFDFKQFFMFREVLGESSKYQDWQFLIQDEGVQLIPEDLNDSEQFLLYRWAFLSYFSGVEVTFSGERISGHLSAWDSKDLYALAETVTDLIDQKHCVLSCVDDSFKDAVESFLSTYVQHILLDKEASACIGSYVSMVENAEFCSVFPLFLKTGFRELVCKLSLSELSDYEQVLNSAFYTLDIDSRFETAYDYALAVQPVLGAISDSSSDYGSLLKRSHFKFGHAAPINSEAPLQITADNQYSVYRTVHNELVTYFDFQEGALKSAVPPNAFLALDPFLVCDQIELKLRYIFPHDPAKVIAALELFFQAAYPRFNDVTGYSDMDSWQSGCRDSLYDHYVDAIYDHYDNSNLADFCLGLVECCLDWGLSIPERIITIIKSDSKPVFYLSRLMGVLDESSAELISQPAVVQLVSLMRFLFSEVSVRHDEAALISFLTATEQGVSTISAVLSSSLFIAELPELVAFLIQQKISDFESVCETDFVLPFIEHLCATQQLLKFYPFLSQKEYSQPLTEELSLEIRRRLILEFAPDLYFPPNWFLEPYVYERPDLKCTEQWFMQEDNPYKLPTLGVLSTVAPHHRVAYYYRLEQGFSSSFSDRERDSDSEGFEAGLCMLRACHSRDVIQRLLAKARYCNRNKRHFTLATCKDIILTIFPELEKAVLSQVDLLTDEPWATVVSEIETHRVGWLYDSASSLPTIDACRQVMVSSMMESLTAGVDLSDAYHCLKNKVEPENVDENLRFRSQLITRVLEKLEERDGIINYESQSAKRIYDFLSVHVDALCFLFVTDRYYPNIIPTLLSSQFVLQNYPELAARYVATILSPNCLVQGFCDSAWTHLNRVTFLEETWRRCGEFETRGTVFGEDISGYDFSSLTQPHTTPEGVPIKAFFFRCFKGNLPYSSQLHPYREFVTQNVDLTIVFSESVEAKEIIPYIIHNLLNKQIAGERLTEKELLILQYYPVDKLKQMSRKKGVQLPIQEVATPELQRNQFIGRLKVLLEDLTSVESSEQYKRLVELEYILDYFEDVSVGLDSESYKVLENAIKSVVTSLSPALDSVDLRMDDLLSVLKKLVFTSVKVVTLGSLDFLKRAVRSGQYLGIIHDKSAAELLVDNMDLEGRTLTEGKRTSLFIYEMKSCIHTRRPISLEVLNGLANFTSNSIHAVLVELYHNKRALLDYLKRLPDATSIVFLAYLSLIVRYNRLLPSSLLALYRRQLRKERFTLGDDLELLMTNARFTEKQKRFVARPRFKLSSLCGSKSRVAPAVSSQTNADYLSCIAAIKSASRTLRK